MDKILDDKKLSLYEKSLKIHRNLWKVYTIALILGITSIVIKDLF